MSTKRTGTRALALLAASALALSACATNDSGDGESEETPTTAPITFTWGYEQEFTSYNMNTASQYALANAVVLNGVLPGFWQFAPDGAVVPNQDIGTYEKTSDDPLTVEYTFHEDAKWSDGEPLDCDDAVLAWLNYSGKGAKTFQPPANTGYEDHPKPECADGDKKFTIVYDRTFADWAAQFGPQVFIPAHVVEEEAGVADVIAAADQPAGADAKKLGEVYNTLWVFKKGELKPEVSPSIGPYTLKAWQANQSITLEANPEWWGTPPKAKTVVIRVMGGDQMAQALQNGEINAMDPQPQTELVNQLKAIGDRIEFSTHDQFTFEHVDFNFKGAFKDKRLREAFAKCLPRQQIVDNLVKPQNPDAKIIQSRFLFPFQPEYADFETGVGGEAFNEVDIEGAKSLVQQAGKTGQVVRIGWLKDPDALNKRRADTIALIQASCNKAGFKVQDSGTATFFDKEWPQGNWDVSLFAWIGSPLVTGSNGIYNTGGGQNPGGYSNPQVDQLLKNLATEIDRDAQVSIMKELDTQLWTDLATIPLFAHPGILATGTNVEGVEYNATQAGLTWNIHAWSLKE